MDGALRRQRRFGHRLIEPDRWGEASLFAPPELDRRCRQLQSEGVQTFSTHAIVRPDHKVEVEHVPFDQGQKVAVFMMTLQKDGSSLPTGVLANSIVRFDAPFEPIAPEEWEATA